ncbi:hypothetical protein BT67DRAFT_380128 [Trichocladium antarcticum]|uniref:histidine kinase n=1 Tax=Trichocladium antarcticum TaxID=1450529 RepID=A0AAN6UKB4_9PEZI|nr:hypothetical protein BT67DRAFT_380128 [Trichocladium antarcticum]
MSAVDSCEDPSHVAVESSERARQREIAAYLSAASFPSDMAVAFQTTPVLNTDPTLNALTQLGALRLNCDRAFVSLIDRQYQYVITEMTRSHSVQRSQCAPGDTVAIGVCKLNNCDGVCPATMKAFMDETGELVNTGPDIISNRTRYIINDFRTHPDYKDRPYVRNYPFFRSYLEVPLVSPLGYLLGSYCVVDSHLNDFDNDDVVEIMNEIAATIMAHLDNVRIKQSRDRSEQLIQGLSGFIRHEPPAQHPAHSVASTGPHGNHGSVCASSFGSSRQPSAPNTASPCVETPQSTETSQSTQSSQSNQSLSLGFSGKNEDGSQTPPTTPRDDPPGNPLEQQLTAAIADGTSPNASAAPSDPSIFPPETSEPYGSGFISSANIKRTFFRAAATIRRSMAMDGLMFLDAVPSSYVDRSDSATHDVLEEQSRNLAEGPFCVSIVKSAIGLEGETTTNSCPTRLPEISLQRFIRAYPQGHVFTADEFGPIDDSYGLGKHFESHPKTDRDSLRLRRDIAALFRVLPFAKYVIFLPLWHFQRECWYAAALGWVENPTRAIEVTDIGLVSAFGNSVMAEVSRLEALAAVRAKSDFVSSISHELRSPLHGIMASSELLRENMSNTALLPTLDMLDSCATTLLDTFNNLLDHAVVTHAGGGGQRSNTTITELKVADLGELVEDVVEAVRVGHLAGNGILMQSALQKQRAKGEGAANPSNGLPDHPLLVTVSVERRDDWTRPLNVGSWKRVVMNLFGNALKYTITGRIDVCLRVVQRTDRKGQSSDYISLTVEDTGLGMSSDYLKYHLFTAFSQEDSHSPGMGLGLSIVQQLVYGLGGVVDVKSSVGVGTVIEVLLPFNKDALQGSPDVPPMIGDKQRLFDKHCAGLAGRVVCLIMPDSIAAIAKPALKVTEKMRDWSKLVLRAINVTAGEALGTKLVLGTKRCPIPDADIYIVDGSILNHTPANDLEALLSTIQSSLATPLVLLCSGTGPPSCLKNEVTKRHPVHIHHPIGPRKLATILWSALKGDFDTKLESLPSDKKPKPLPPNKKRESLAPPVVPLRPQTGPISPQPPQRPPVLEERKTKNAPKPTLAVAQLQLPRKRHLLLVDDNPINIKLLVVVVSKLNHTFVTASNGLEAVELYKKSLGGGNERRFDLVFMDISMPVMNGFEATRGIRQLEADAGVGRCRVVAVTGLSSELNRNEAAASGCDLFLTKPVKMNTVRGLLDEMSVGGKEGGEQDQGNNGKGGHDVMKGKHEHEGMNGNEGSGLVGGTSVSAT